MHLLVCKDSMICGVRNTFVKGVIEWNVMMNIDNIVHTQPTNYV